MDPAAAAEAGFAGIAADPALKAEALRNFALWLREPEFAPYRPQLLSLVERGQWSTLLDSFYQVIPFGTGGRRGAVGVGPNRLNPWTVGASVQGHAQYLRQRFSGASPLRVVLAYDVRKFTDRRGVYDPAKPNPVLGMTSRDFCVLAAEVYAANGVQSLILPPDTQRYVSTPELSFTIRHLSAHGGLNVTASHNPPDDNGTKFYTELGSQPVAPEDQLMSEFVAEVTAVRRTPWADAVREGKVHFLDDGPHQAYVALCRKQSLVPPPRSGEIRVVYTPLHGVGGFAAGEVLAAQGFAPIPVPEQMAPDGQFPNVTKTPNPEVPECMDRAEAVARREGADLVIATDPDADRLGGLACTSPDGRGDYRFVTGNELCSLLTWFKLNRLAAAGDLPASPIVITTEVTTGQVTRIGRQYGAQVVDDILVGFKYHADVVHKLETEGRYGDVSGTPADFIIATEESHGVMATAALRDKDSACAALLLAELALHLKRQGRTIPGLLDDLSRQFGYYRNELLNIVMTGLEGKEQMARMLDALRRTPPSEVAGLPVSSTEDLWNEEGRMGPFQGDTDRAARNFLIFRLADPAGRFTAKVCLRPSGTEPKAKAYLEVASAPCPPGTSDEAWGATQGAVDAQVQRLATEFLALALGTVGLTPAPGADKLSR